MNRLEAEKYRKKIEQSATFLSDSEAYYVPELFQRWSVGINVAIDERLCYDNKLYKVIQNHTTQEGWEPNLTPALFTEVPMPGTIPVWTQPTGAQDTYMQGDRVHYPTISDPIYESIVDNNSWAPNVYGWTLVQG